MWEIRGVGPGWSRRAEKQTKNSPRQLSVKSSPESAHTVHTVPPQTQPDVHVYGMNVQGWIKARHCDCQEAKKWQEWNKDIQRSRGARRVGRAKIVVVIGTNPGALIFVDFDSSHPKICPMILVLAFFFPRTRTAQVWFRMGRAGPRILDQSLSRLAGNWCDTVATPQKFTETSKTVVLKEKMTHSHDLFMFVWGSHGVPSFENLPTGFEIPENSSSTVCHSWIAAVRGEFLGKAESSSDQQGIEPVLCGWLVWASLSSVKQHDRGYKP